MRKLLIVVLVLILSEAGNARTIAPPRAECADSEILWFGSTGETVLACWPDGTICYWHLNTGKPISHFKINEYVAVHEYHQLNQQVFVSQNDTLLLGVIDDNATCQDGLFCTAVSFYDILTGQQTKTIKIREVGQARGHGFSRDGRLFFCSFCALGRVVLCLDTQTGKVRWRSEYPDVSPLMRTYIFKNGTGYVNLFTSAGVVARNSEGKLLWRKLPTRRRKIFGWYKGGKGMNWVEPVDVQSEGPSDIILVWTKDDTIAAMSLADGAILWEKNKAGIDVCATTVDRKKQAFYINGELEIWSLPNNKVVRLQEVNERCEAVFTENGKCLLCLPALKKVGKDRKAHTYTIARKSNILKVIDTQTGKITRKFELKKP